MGYLRGCSILHADGAPDREGSCSNATLMDLPVTEYRLRLFLSQDQVIRANHINC